MGFDDRVFQERLYGDEKLRPGDTRTEYQRDRARIVHSSAFRRLQGKTQVMGVGEGDFHRTRLTHSIECAQISYGLVHSLSEKYCAEQQLHEILPNRDLIEATSFAHDLGHPPFGHGGERALQSLVSNDGGFEGNAQTLRIISRLEKYRVNGQGINPTRRLVLAVLKYPVSYNSFGLSKYSQKPPKCFYSDEADVVNWALEPFCLEDRKKLVERNEKDRPIHKTLDCSIMELADDIAYGVHDIEDIVARRLAKKQRVQEKLEKAFTVLGTGLKADNRDYDPGIMAEELFSESGDRKQLVSRLVNLFVTQARIYPVDGFEHPLLRYKVALSENLGEFLDALKKVSFQLVVEHARVQHLEFRGQVIVSKIFDALKTNPKGMIPEKSWSDLSECSSNEARCITDYVAGMTDSFAEKIYHRLYTPGIGSSSDEM